MNPRLYSFTGGDDGPWAVRSITAIHGEPLADCLRVRITHGEDVGTGVWSLRGVTSNERYVTTEEKRQLAAVQEPLGRPEATCAAMIPIKKSDAWWALSQEERKAIMDDQGRHTAVGLEYLPAVARRLHHCRDMATAEPFDFIAWLEFAPEYERQFDELLARLRATPEWGYIEREVEIRLACG